MTKHTRLKVQSPAKSRRVVYYIVFFLFLGLSIWLAEEHYRVSERIQITWNAFKENISRGNPPRGTIFDRNLKQMAVTLERVSVYARTREVEEIEKTVKSLGTVLPLDQEHVQEQLQSGVLRVWLAEDISEEQEVAVKALKLPGVYMQREEHRFYPNGSRAAHILGYAEGGIGLAGVELYYDHLLAERKLALQHSNKPIVDSQELVLNLDLKIQEMVEEVLGEIKKNAGAQQAIAYLIENGTGQIVSAAHIPSFDPNNFTQVSPEIFNNRFLEPLPLPAAFRVYFRDLSALYSRKDNDHLPWSVSAVADSLVPNEEFLEKTGVIEGATIDLFDRQAGREEVKPVFSPAEVSSAALSGMPVQMSPMALLDSMATVLSGYVTTPAVVKKIIDAGSGLESVLSGAGMKQKLEGGEGLGTALDEAHPLLESMSSTAASGATYLRDQILAVTGTKWNTEFVLFDFIFVSIPVGENDLSMLIMLSKSPEGPGREHVDKAIEIIETKISRITILQQVSRTIADVLEPEENEEENFQGRKISVKKSEEGLHTNSEVQMVLGVMPDLTGLSLRKSLRMIQGMPLEISIQGTGKVISQKPPPGTPIKQRVACLLILKQESSLKPD